MPKFTLDILYILLDYCDPIDTNIMTVVDELVDDSEKDFDKFIKYSIQKSKRDSLDRTSDINDMMKKDRKDQLEKFEEMKRRCNYKIIPSYNNEIYKTIKCDEYKWSELEDFYTDNNAVINPIVNTPIVNTPIVNTPVINIPITNYTVVNTGTVNTIDSLINSVSNYN